jgi:hypothetical protein
MEPRAVQPSWGQDTQRFSPREIRIGGDFHRALASANNDYLEAESLAKSCIVGRANIRIERIDVRFLYHVPRKCLRRLDAPKSIAIDSLGNLSITCHTLERVDDWNSRDCTMSPAGFGYHTLDHVVRNERSRGVMDDHDLRRFGEILESVSHRIAALASPDRDEHSLEVTLEKPWRWVTSKFLWKNNDDRSNVIAILECVKAVQQHRLSGNPAKLLELIPFSSRARTRRNYHDAYVSRAHENSLPNRSATD